MKTTTFSAPDIECQGCASAIKKAVGNVPGVSQVNVDVAAKTVAVTHDEKAPARRSRRPWTAPASRWPGQPSTSSLAARGRCFAPGKSS